MIGVCWLPTSPSLGVESHPSQEEKYCCIYESIIDFSVKIIAFKIFFSKPVIPWRLFIPTFGVAGGSHYPASLRGWGDGSPQPSRNSVAPCGARFKTSASLWCAKICTSTAMLLPWMNQYNTGCQIICHLKTPDTELLRSDLTDSLPTFVIWH